MAGRANARCARLHMHGYAVALTLNDQYAAFGAKGIAAHGAQRVADVHEVQTFLTAGENESRAWTIHKGDTAPKAAVVIHTDFERGFIKADIVSYDDLVELGSLAEARAHGKMRMEGKDYVMEDGDVVEFRTGLTSGSKK